MLSDKVKRYLIAHSKEELFASFGNSHQIEKQFSFGTVLLIKEGTELFAIKNKCPHQGAAMFGCSIHEGKVICPLHRYSFDLENGRGHGLYLETFPIIYNKEGVFIERTYFSWFGE
jgi:3-phenylpropionate/trans-cinnamate dioxygenase ferredoxin subunit